MACRPSAANAVNASPTHRAILRIAIAGGVIFTMMMVRRQMVRKAWVNIMSNEAINNAPGETEVIAKLAHALEQLVRPPIPLSIDLWDLEMIGQYLKRDTQVIRERIACLPDFPAPIRLPSKKGRAHPLYRAKEVIAWAEGHRDTRGRSKNRP